MFQIMENRFLNNVQHQVEKSLKAETSTLSFFGAFSNPGGAKSDFDPQAPIKVPQENLNILYSPPEVQKGPGQHLCSVCGRSFPYRYQLIVHARYHALPDIEKVVVTQENSLNGWAPPPPPPPPHPPKADPKHQFPCSYCEKCFSRKEHLASHMARHTGENLHECTLCSKNFSRKDHLENHLRAHDSDFKCHICFKIFTRKEHLVNHVNWHTGTSPHKCELCRKVFTRKEHLVNHVRQHTGESPHVCRYCRKAFTRREHVENHERGHTGETPFKCSECGRAFSRKDHLTSHERSHVELSHFRCEPCGKGFVKREHLASHQRHHHTVKIKRNKSHKKGAGGSGGGGEGVGHPAGQHHVERSHLGPTPYTCQICSKSFQLKGNLIFHMNSHSVQF